MDDDKLLRYSRHILLPEIGVEGQERLMSSHVLVVGAGGLGSPACMYLAVSGVGEITVADGDKVDLTNLQRQIAHYTADIGVQKVTSTKQTLLQLNPSVVVNCIPKNLKEKEIEVQVDKVDLVIDCTDNFETRHNINRACVKYSKPLVSGAAIRFEGQVAVFDQSNPDSPCYECLYPGESDLEEMRCAVMGVFSPLVGIIGSTQAMEAIKVLAKIGNSMNGRLLLFNSLTAEWKVLSLHKDEFCNVCGKSATHNLAP